MSGGRGAAKPPLSYEGEYDATRTYLPREVVQYAGVAYMAIAKVTGVLPTVAASWLPFGGGGGGGAALLGVAQVHMPSNLAVTSDGSSYHFTSSSVVASHGSPAVASASGYVTYSVGDAPGFYVMNAVVGFDSSSTNAVSTDAHQIQMFDPIMGWLTCGFVGSSSANTGYGLPYAASYTNTVEVEDRVQFRALCTGGTNRVHHIELLMFIARFAIPT